MQQTTIDLLRHGEVAGGQYFRGRCDDPVTELGRQQMQQQCLGYRWDAVISSPLQRCSAFAADWCEQQNLVLQLNAGWQEIDFGDWEGLTAEQIEQRHPGQLGAFYTDPAGFTPTQAEPYATFVKRINLAWQQVLSSHMGQQVLIVTHGGVIRQLFAQLLGVSIRQAMAIAVPHACMTRFVCFHEQESLSVQLVSHRPL